MIGIHTGVLQAEEQGYTTLAITVPPSVAPTTVLSFPSRGEGCTRML